MVITVDFLMAVFLMAVKNMADFLKIRQIITAILKTAIIITKNENNFWIQNHKFLRVTPIFNDLFNSDNYLSVSIHYININYNVGPISLTYNLRQYIW